MKTKLITVLKKKVLLVDGLPKNFRLNHNVNGFTFFTNAKNINPKPILKVDGLWTWLGGDQVRIKDISEEQCAELLGFRANLKNRTFSYKQSVMVHLEHAGVLCSNPYGTYVENYKDCPEFDKAEQNVFSENTLIFVEQ